jgi:hypothetical protein
MLENPRIKKISLILCPLSAFPCRLRPNVTGPNQKGFMKLIQLASPYFRAARMAPCKKATLLLLSAMTVPALHASQTLFGSTPTISYLYPTQATTASSMSALAVGSDITILSYYNLNGTSGVTAGDIASGNFFTETEKADSSGYQLTCPGQDIGSGVCLNFRQQTTISIGVASISIHEGGGSGFGIAGPGVNFNGLDFSGLNFGPGYQLSGFTLTTDLPGLTASDVSFTGSSIEYNAIGTSFYNAPYTITLDLATSSTAPEPATLGLLGLALIGFALRGRSAASTKTRH